MVNFLKATFGEAVTDEVIGKFNEELGKKFVAKTDYNGKIKEIEGLKSQILDRDGQLKTLKDGAGNNEELKKQIEKLQNDNKAAKAAYEKQLHEIKFNSALDNAILKSGAIDGDLVKVKLDQGSLRLNENGTLEGLDDQMKDIKENYRFLFKAKETETTSVTGAKPADGEKQMETDPFLQGFVN